MNLNSKLRPTNYTFFFFRAAQLLGRRESLALLRGDLPRSQLAGGTQNEAFSLAFVSGPSVHGSCDVVETRLSCLRTQHPDILILTNQPGDHSKGSSLIIMRKFLVEKQHPKIF